MALLLLGGCGRRGPDAETKGAGEALATVAQADFIEANRAELAAHVLREEALGTADTETARQLRLLLEATGNLAAASLLIRDILRRRLVIAPGTDGFGAVQWGRA